MWLRVFQIVAPNVSTEPHVIRAKPKKYKSHRDSSPPQKPQEEGNGKKTQSEYINAEINVFNSKPRQRTKTGQQLYEQIWRRIRRKWTEKE